MVRSKEVPKRPKDPLMTPPSKPRGFRDDDGGSLPRNRGGAAMSPAPASVPSYMRATSSSGAKAGPGRRAGAVPSSASPTTRRGPARVVTRGRVLFPTPEVPGMVRATCSSTMKEAKFPGALDLAPGATDAQGPAAMRVCPYNYCSLNGHTHSPAVPLRSFLASRRRLIKTQQSMKHKGVSAFRKGSGHQRPEDKKSSPVACAAVDEEALGDFFVEVYAGPRVSSDMSCSDMSLDEMDAAVRRMEFVVFDRCGVGEDDEKGGDPAVRGDGGGRPEEDRLGFCRDSSPECSDDGVSGLISGNLVEELPWMRYECDSLDDDVSEEHVQEAEVSEGQQGEDEERRSRGSGDNHEEEADEEQKPEDAEIISDLPRETGIIAEEEGVDCRVEICEDISNTMDQQEASTVQETQHEDDEERVSDVAHKMEIAAAQACIVCAVEVCNKQEEEDQDNILILGKVIQGDASDGQGTSEEQLSNGVCEPEIPESEAAERVENVLEESRVDESSAAQEANDDQSNVESTGNLEVTEKQDMPDHGSEMEISETVPSVACEEDFIEEEVASRAVSEGEISDCSDIASPDVEISTPPTEGGFEQDVNTMEDAFERSVNNLVDQCIPAEGAVDVTEDAQKEIEITSCNLEDACEESGTAQESSQEVDFVCVDAAAQMEPEPEVTNCKLEDSSEESGIAQESSQNVKPVCVDAAAQTEPEPEVTNCKLEDSSEEESGIAQDVKPVCVDAAAQMEPETTNCNLEDASAEAGITGETVHDDTLAYVGEVAHVQSGVDTSELVDISEESGIARDKIGEDDNSAYVSDDAQSDSGIATCELGEESATVQDHNCTDVNGGSTDESALTPCELAEASEAYDITQEAIQDDNTSDVNDGAQKESEIIACESEHACEESDIIQEGGEDDNTAGVCTGALKEQEIIAAESVDACEEVCNTVEANLSPVVQIPEHNYDLSATDAHQEPQNLPAEDNVAKEFSIDDMCNVFSGMNLKGDVYVDPTESEICPRNRMIVAGRRRTPEEDEYMRGFNPRAPNFLPLESDPDAEKVDLKHQTAEDRKNAEEWMIDYALRRAVNNLGPARKKKVELLVQAFETVLPQDDKKNISPTRPAQACN